MTTDYTALISRLEAILAYHGQLTSLGGTLFQTIEALRALKRDCDALRAERDWRTEALTAMQAKLAEAERELATLRKAVGYELPNYAPGALLYPQMTIEETMGDVRIEVCDIASYAYQPGERKRYTWSGWGKAIYLGIATLRLEDFGAKADAAIAQSEGGKPQS